MRAQPATLRSVWAGVVAGASVDSMGLLPPQQGAAQRSVFPVAILKPPSGYSFLNSRKPQRTLSVLELLLRLGLVIILLLVAGGGRSSGGRWSDKQPGLHRISRTPLCETFARLCRSPAGRRHMAALGSEAVRLRIEGKRVADPRGRTACE